MSCIAKLFNLKNNYTMKDLSDAYKQKILEIESNNSLSDIDKHLLKMSYKKNYNRAQYDILFNYKHMLDHDLSNTSYHARVYKSTTNKDGIETVYETKEEVTDGKKNKITNAFTRYPDGKVIPIEIKGNNKYKLLRQ